ncbi:transposase [Mesorhizobium sp. M0048]
MRDLIRAREAAVKDRTRKRQEIRSFLLRHGKIYPGLKAWGTKYLKWLHGLSFSYRSQQAVLQELILAESQCRERVARLEKAIEDGLLDWPLAPVVERLQALRGVQLICAATFMVEIGDVRRFANPRQLMAYLLISDLSPRSARPGTPCDGAVSQRMGMPECAASWPRAPGLSAIRPNCGKGNTSKAATCLKSCET